MCDTIKTKNLPDDKKPEYVYKRVQKVGEGKYISPVMGEQLKLNTWKKAPSRAKMKDVLDNGKALVLSLKRSYNTTNYCCSSRYEEHHDGMWGTFKTLKGASMADLVSNFVYKKTKFTIAKYPTIIVKCEVKGTVHSSTFNTLGENINTFLVEYIKVIEEVEKIID